MKRGYDYEQSADYLGCSARKVQEEVRAGKIPAKYIGNKVVIDIADLDAYFDSLPTERVSATVGHH